MSQVTRCPSCGTRFKVVADQLRISQGWVRCGVCQHVFDAAQDLQNWSSEGTAAPAATAAAAPGGAPAGQDLPKGEPMAAAARQAAGDAPELELELLADAEPEPALTGPAWPQPEAQALPPAEEAAALPQLPARGGLAQPAEVPAALLVQRAQAVAEQAEPDDRREAPVLRRDGPAAAATEPEEPDFMRQARHQAFWHSPAMRGALLLGCVLAGAALALQVMWQQRDALAARQPALAPALRTLCLAAGCRLQPRREIADVVISSSGFQQLPGRSQYQWSLSLENRSAVPVAMPAVELTLTDAQDRPLLRRVILLEPLGAPAQLQGREEWSVNVPVQVQDLPAAVAGYRALVFYP